MAELDVGKATTTNLAGTVSDVTVAAKQPDAVGAAGDERVWDFPDASKHLGYYDERPELQSALHVFALRVAGLGWTASERDTVELKRLRGWGQDTFDSIIRMMVVEMKIFGDAFAEIIQNEKGTLINLKKLYTGDMRIVLNEQGLIERYEQRSNIPNGKSKPFEPHKIFHLCNNRIANEIHGTSLIPVLKEIIDAKKEALADERKIRHRELALGVLYVDEDDTTKLNAIKTKYQDAVNKGEVLILPKDVAILGDNPNSPRDRIQYMQYLDNEFSRVVGTPKVLTTTEGFTEAGGKAGLIAFEPTEISAKIELEANIWGQLAKRIKYVRTPSLLGEEQATQQKNAGQVGIQPNETQVSATRTE